MSRNDELDDHRSLSMSEIMTPEKANFAGNIHGGHLLGLLDRVAYACAARYSQKYVVTLSVDQVLFKSAIHVGELVRCHANVNYVGRSSMEIGIKVLAENLETGEIRHTNSCYFTMVALDKQGKPVTIKPLVMRNDLDRRRFEESLMRKEIRSTLSHELEKRKTALKERFKPS